MLNSYLKGAIYPPTTDQYPFSNKKKLIYVKKSNMH
jgi:hypothetical protein